eukprot:scaffold105720_cov21-Tisochrysis_lutea.AAC.1
MRGETRKKDIIWDSGSTWLDWDNHTKALQARWVTKCILSSHGRGASCPSLPLQHSRGARRQAPSLPAPTGHSLSTDYYKNAPPPPRCPLLFHSDRAVKQ